MWTMPEHFNKSEKETNCSWSCRLFLIKLAVIFCSYQIAQCASEWARQQYISDMVGFYNILT
jgi:hypothetical protein